MKTKIAGAVGVIVLSLAVVGALHFRGVAAESERELAALTAKKAEAAKALAAAQDRAMAAARDEQELSSALAAAEEQQKQAAAAHDKAAAEAKARTTALARNDIGALLEANPELRALFRKSFQADQRLRYAPLIQQLGLDEAKVQRLLDMATDLEETGFDITSAAHAQGLADDDPALAHMRKDASAKVRPAVMEILGEQGYAQYEQYQRMAPLSGFVGEVSSLAIGSGAPLSVEQTGKLMNLMASASSSFQSGGRAEGSSIEWPKVLAQAPNFLSPPQVAALKAQAELPAVMGLMGKFYGKK